MDLSFNFGEDEVRGGVCGFGGCRRHGLELVAGTGRFQTLGRVI